VYWQYTNNEEISVRINSLKFTNDLRDIISLAIKHSGIKLYRNDCVAFSHSPHLHILNFSKARWSLMVIETNQVYMFTNSSAVHTTHSTRINDIRSTAFWLKLTAFLPNSTWYDCYYCHLNCLLHRSDRTRPAFINSFDSNCLKTQ